MILIVEFRWVSSFFIQGKDANDISVFSSEKGVKQNILWYDFDLNFILFIM